MLEINFERFIDANEGEITHYAIWGRITDVGENAITLVDEERFRRLTRMDHAGRIKKELRDDSTTIRLTPLASGKGEYSLEDLTHLVEGFEYLLLLYNVKATVVVSDESNRSYSGDV